MIRFLSCFFHSARSLRFWQDQPGRCFEVTLVGPSGSPYKGNQKLLQCPCTSNVYCIAGGCFKLLMMIAEVLMQQNLDSCAIFYTYLFPLVRFIHLVQVPSYNSSRPYFTLWWMIRVFITPTQMVKSIFPDSWIHTVNVNRMESSNESGTSRARTCRAAAFTRHSNVHRFRFRSGMCYCELAARLGRVQFRQDAQASSRVDATVCSTHYVVICTQRAPTFFARIPSHRALSFHAASTTGGNVDTIFLLTTRSDPHRHWLSVARCLDSAVGIDARTVFVAFTSVAITGVIV